MQSELVGLNFIAQAKEYLVKIGDDAYSGTTTYRFGNKK
jgi:hypothetical protein